MAPPNKRKKRLRHQLARLLFSLQSMVSSSLLTSPVKVPVPTFLYRERVGERSRSLVVLLPGKGSRGEDFERRGFVRAARDRCLGADRQRPGHLENPRRWRRSGPRDQPER